MDPRASFTKYSATDPWRKVVLENALDAVVGMNEHNEIIDWNRQAEVLFGFTRDEVVGKCLADIIIPPSFRQPHQNGLKHFLATGEGPILNKRIEVPALRKNGGQFLAELTVIPIRIEETFLFYSFIRDITELKETRTRQEVLHQRLELLSTVSTVLLADPLGMESRLVKFAHLLVPAVGDGCVLHVLDGEGKTRLAAMTHKDPAQEEPFRDWLEQTESAEIQRLFRRTLKERSPQLLAEVSPSLFHGMASVMCLPLLAHNETLGTLTLFSSGEPYDKDDLSFATELAGRAAFALYNASLYQNVTEALSARDEFLSIASHELKTPLSSLKLHTELFERVHQKNHDTLEAPTKKLLGTYHRNIERMGRLIEDMLDIARISNGRLRLEKAPVKLDELVKETLEKLSAELTQAKVKVNSDLQGPAEILGDAFRLEQVVTNLITNVIKYAPGSEMKVALKLKSSVVVLSVEDHGKGIAPQNLERIFGRFERAISANISGLGLGLYISRQIVEGHSGKIWAESTEGKGSTLFVEIPLAPKNKNV